MSLPLVILAAGLSTRYGSLKQLDPLGPGGEVIMDYNVYDALRAGFSSVCFVVRREIEDAVRAHVASVFGEAVATDWVRQETDRLPEGYRAPPERRKPWGTAHAVVLAAERIEGAFAVCNADDLYGPAAFRALHDYLVEAPAEEDGALVGYRLQDTLSGSGGVSRAICHVGRGSLLEQVIEIREIRRRDGLITGIEGDATPVELAPDDLVSMNLWGLAPALVRGMRHGFRRFLDVWGADTTQELYLSTAINQRIQAGARVRVLHAGEAWFGLTHPEDRDHFRALLAERIAAGVYPERLAGAVRGSEGGS
ncbi:MAG TPA: hypothetical protein VFQ22_07915 [Longimicrobiales bacterium]|nr:hypothetical protein [Longimicrobiales bacterium]